MDQPTSPNINIPKQRKFLGINWTNKKIIWTAIILLVVIFIVIRFRKGKNNSANIQTATVQKQDLKATVLATGQVVSSTDVNLSFKGSGVVQKINVKAGDKVQAGQTLATLDQSAALASLTTAQGSLAQAQANYEKVVEGSTNQQIAVAQKAVDAAQVTLQNASNTLATVMAQQNTAVKNAYATLLNTSITAVPNSGNLDTVAPIITGTYNGSQQGVYNISIYPTGSGLKYQISGLETATGNVQTQPAPMGNLGLYIQFSTNPSSNDTWTVNIPNTYSSTYVTNYNAYQTALQTSTANITTAQNQVNTAQTTLAQAQASLAETEAGATSAEIDAAKAQIISAQGQVQSAQVILGDTVIRAPADGTITSIDGKVGQLAQALQEIMVLQDVESLHVEADVSEANIASLQPGQNVDLTFDALGPDRHFTGAVLSIDPGATVVSGVVDYLVKASIPSIPEIKPGMTANMTVLVAQESGKLAVPSSAIISQNGKKYVRVVDNTKTKTYHQVEVQTGLNADGGLIEITSGLNEGQEVVTYIKQ